MLHRLLRPLASVAAGVRLALGQIWANKVRALLTTVGIVIGVASVTVVVAAVTGLERRVISEINQFGANNLFVFPDRPDDGPQSQLSRRVINFSPDEFDGLAEAAPSIAAFTRITSRRLTIRHGDEVRVKNVTGIEPAWHSIESRNVIEGRPFNAVDQDDGRTVCLIDEETRDELKLPVDAVGQDILLDGRRFRVVGIIEPSRELPFGGPPETNVYIPFSTLWRMDSNPWRTIYVAARATDATAVEEAEAEVKHYMRSRRNIGPGQEDTFGVRRVEAALEQVRTIGRAITFAASGVVGISLLVGGVGIMNIMLVSVSERTREIGLRKAVGARPNAILLQFLIEAVVLCVVGGLVGLALGQGLTLAVRYVPNSPLDQAAVPAWAALLAVGFSAAVGLTFGLFPALKASRLDPIVALRHE